MRCALDKKKGILNVAVSILFKIILLAGSIIIRRLLIERLGNGINGINSLYISIIGLLSVAELGVGGAITYCMYKPIVEGNKERVAALFNYFKRAYFIIGIVIFSLGVLIMPALPFLAEGHNIYTSELYSSYIILLISVAASYMFGAKLSLINAHKNNYITTTLLSLGMIGQYILQALVLIFTPSFDGYLLCAFVSLAIQWVSCKPFDSAVSNTSQSPSFSASFFPQCSVIVLSPCKLKKAMEMPPGKGKMGSCASNPSKSTV
jgi:hypothetical protein